MIPLNANIVIDKIQAMMNIMSKNSSAKLKDPVDIDSKKLESKFF